MRRAVVLLFLAAACADEHEVHGVAQTVYLTPSGEVTVPRDINELRVYAIVEKEDDRLDVILGHGNTDGTFEIVGVTSGKYYLGVGSALYYTNASDFVLET